MQKFIGNRSEGGNHRSLKPVACTQRAEYANREMHIRLLLELVEIMDDTRENGVAIERAEKNAACYDYEDFFFRTRYKIPEGILSRAGHIITFDDAMVIRFLDTVTVCDDG